LRHLRHERTAAPAAEPLAGQAAQIPRLAPVEPARLLLRRHQPPLLAAVAAQAQQVALAALPVTASLPAGRAALWRERMAPTVLRSLAPTAAVVAAVARMAT
jgi:hypothetical protein